MVSADRFRQICLALEGTLETPHVDRAAFRVKRIYATLAPDGKTANVKLQQDEQALFVEMHPDAFAPVAGGWGRMGWTTVDLATVRVGVLSQVLASAWSSARPSPAKKARRGKAKPG